MEGMAPCRIAPQNAVNQIFAVLEDEHNHFTWLNALAFQPLCIMLDAPLEAGRMLSGRSSRQKIGR